MRLRDVHSDRGLTPATTTSKMNQRSDEADDEVAALTAGPTPGWAMNNSGRRSAPIDGSSHDVLDTRRASARSVSNMNHVNSNHEEEGFPSILPPTPGDFHRNMNNYYMSMNPNPLKNPKGSTPQSAIIHNNLTLTNPLGATNTVGTSQFTAVLDPHPEELLNSTNSPYSNYETIMTSLGHYQNTMSYGQVTRMNSGYGDRELEICQEFELAENAFDSLQDGFEFDDYVDTGVEFDEETFDKQEVIDVQTNTDHTNLSVYPPLSSSGVNATSAVQTFSRRTITLKEWIELHKPDGSSSQNHINITPGDGKVLTDRQMVYIEKVTKISCVIVSKIIRGLKRIQNKQGCEGDTKLSFGIDEEWEPRPRDIAVEYITVTESALTNDGKENATAEEIKIEDVHFDLLKDFDWGDSALGAEDNCDVSMLHAVGRLIYVLLMEKEENFPARSSNSDGFLEMLSLLADNGDEDKSGGRGNQLFEKMKDAALPVKLCRLICDICNEDGKGPRSITLADVLSELEQMMALPAAFLYGTITSRWELVFGGNYLFGRDKELNQLIDAALQVEQSGSEKPVVLISGEAGCGKSKLVQEVRKVLKAKGWTFLRCKFEKAMQSKPLLVVALGLDEFCISTMPCFPDNIPDDSSGVKCTCLKQSCPRKVIRELNNLVGLDGVKNLCRWMPIFRRLVKESYPMHANYLDDDIAQQEYIMSEQETHDLLHLMSVLLEVMSSTSPVLFFVDDLQWADTSTLKLLISLISMVGSTEHAAASKCALLFLGACRIDDGLTKEVIYSNLSEKLQPCECISLAGIDIESLKNMMSEVLCLPCRNIAPLAKAIHQKTQGIPLFVIEFIDTLLAEKLLTESDELIWEWDIDAINRKSIPKGVAELHAKKLEHLPQDAMEGLQILSCFDSQFDVHGVDLEVIEAVKNYDAIDSKNIVMALDSATKDFLHFYGSTVAFSHDLIQKIIFEQIPDQTGLLLKLIKCCVAKCQVVSSGKDMYVFAAANLMNKIDNEYTSSNPQQRQLFAEYNLETGKRLINQAKFVAALSYLQIGLELLSAQGNSWDSNYSLITGIVSNMAVANYSLGNLEECFAQANEVFDKAKVFEDKFLAYIVYIKVVGSQSADAAIEKLVFLLPVVGEPIDLNAISQQMAVDEMMTLKEALSGNRKDIMLQLSPITDKSVLMTMKLMALLLLFISQKETYLSGYLASRMIQISLKYGQCEDTLYAMATFSSSFIVNDLDEAYALANLTLSMMQFYKVNQLIPRLYGHIYGNVLSIKNTVQSTLNPLSNACHLAFSRGLHEHAIPNTLAYILKTIESGKKLSFLIDELVLLTEKHHKLKQSRIITYFLAPTYKTVSMLSGNILDDQKILLQYANETPDDFVAAALDDFILVRAAVIVKMFECIMLRDFTKASEMTLNYSHFFEQVAPLEVNLNFMAGLVWLHMARTTRESSWIERGTKMLAAYENWSIVNRSDNEHKYLLLKAEYHQFKGETVAAIEAYQASINSAHSNQFIFHEAIACEMAAHHFGNIGEKNRTREMIRKTHDVYMEWGAKAKAKSVLELLNLRYLDDTVLNTT